MFLTFDASLGVVFTLKALIIVILGGVSDIRGTILARLHPRICRDDRGDFG